MRPKRFRRPRRSLLILRSLSLVWITCPELLLAQSSPFVLKTEQERDVLVALYQYTLGDSWSRRQDWLSTTTHYCEWEGISCISLESPQRKLQVDASRSIDAINLADNHLQGSVPMSLLLLLPNIRTLKLNGNSIDFANMAQQEHDVIGQILNQPVTSLIQHLDVSHTNVRDLKLLFSTGNGTTTVATPDLTDFYASQAQIYGSFPSFLTSLTSLKRLGLDHNSLTGTLPNAIGKWQSLQYLSLSSNNMVGTLPNTVTQWKKIRYVLLEANQLNGTIPLGLTSAEYTPLLEQLDVSDQRPADIPPSTTEGGLSGPIPPFDTQKRLRRLDLGVNSFTGTIPSTLLEAAANLEFVVLSSNLITGSVPSTVLKRIPVDGIFLENNRITVINEKDCSGTAYGCKSILCPPLTYEPRSGRQEEQNRPCLSCPENKLYWGQTDCGLDDTNEDTPTVTPGNPTLVPNPSTPTQAPVGTPTSLAEEKSILLDLYKATGGNGWTMQTGWSDPKENPDFCSWYGIVCTTSDDIPSVESLHLDSNALAGSMPDTLYDLPKIKEINLSNNGRLEVTFTNIQNAPYLEVVDVSSTVLQSTQGLANASPRLQELHMSSMIGIDGKPIPSEIFELTNLQQLTLDFNNAIGTIPTIIGSLSRLVVFSAADNSFIGSIPTTIAMLTDLSTLRLTSNHLSGSLPPGMATMSSLSDLDLSNQWSNGQDDDFGSDGRSGLTGKLPSFRGFQQMRRLDLAVNSFSGTIPDDFLADVNRESGGLFEYADISVNYLTGTVPGGLAGLHDVYMQENHLTGINSLVCALLPSDLIEFGCDAVLCAPGSYSQLGRQTSEYAACEACEVGGGAQFYGSTECFASGESPSTTPQNDSPTSVPVGSAAVRAALKRIYDTCGGTTWITRANWLDDQSSVCDWDGIQCSTDGEVVGISLRSNNLAGTFPSETVFGAIPTLETLIVDGNTLSFPFTGILNATKLETLDLTSTELDSIEGIEAAPSLMTLYLSSNNLRGTMPSALFQLQGLKQLALAFNGLTGTIPQELSTLTNLEFLALHDNDITGTIPTEFGQLKKLFFLLLQGNELNGSIPSQLSTLTALRFLDLSAQTSDDGGGLTGELPSFAVLPDLKRVDLSNNKLAGTVPTDFLGATSLQSFDDLDISFNQFTGELPGVLAKFPIDSYEAVGNRFSKLSQALCDASLGGIVAAYGCNAVLCPPGMYNSQGRQLTDGDRCESCPENQFYGAVTCGNSSVTTPTSAPIVKGNLTDKQILATFYDSLNGNHWTRRDRWKDSSVSVCEWFGIRCSVEGVERIEDITLSANNLIGVTPTQIFQLPYLESLVLDSNKIQFNFSGIANARSLTTLDLSNTGTSSIEGVGNANQLQELHFASNSLGGPLPTEIFRMTSLEQLSFDFNEFTGSIPDIIGQLTNLKLLSCEKNLLTGSIPRRIESLTSLVTLRLGRNSLTGYLPTNLESLTSLSFLDLAHQTELGSPGFTGPLLSFANLTRLRQISLKANTLSGTIPIDFLQNVTAEVFEYADLSANALVGTIPSSLAKISSLFLQDNFITGIQAFCDGSTGVVIDEYGCDAVLCPPGHYNSHGRQESDRLICLPCPEATFYGSTTCPPGSGGQSPTASPPSGAPVNERNVLMKFYSTCGGDNWDASLNWMEPSESICNWAGIVCAEGSNETVAAIEFGANNVIGVPPAELFSLPNLKKLSLYSNPLDGFSFVGIENAQSLEELSLDATGIESIAGIGKAPKLTTVNLRFNRINGTFPSEIAQLTALQTLTLADNELSGSLPTYLESMTRLQSLLLSSNHIHGTVRGINFPASLRILDLSQNALSGPIPDSFLTLLPFSADVDVDLSDNKLTGTIPSDLTRFDQMNLFLKGNQFTRLDKQLCQKKLWNNGDVGVYGCDGLVCPIGHAAPNGRQTSAGGCVPCDNAPHLGTAHCESSGSTATRGGRTWLVWVMVLLGGTASLWHTCAY